MLVEPVMVEDETITHRRLFNDVELPHPRARKLVFVCVPYSVGIDEIQFRSSEPEGLNVPQELINVLLLVPLNDVQCGLVMLLDMYRSTHCYYSVSTVRMVWALVQTDCNNGATVGHEAEIV